MSQSVTQNAESPDSQSVAHVVRKKRIGVVCINREWPDPSSIVFQTLYEGIGKNTGNLMFTEAVFRLIDGDLTAIGFSFDPAWVNANLDAVVIPAANWINDYSDWDWLTKRLAELKVPVTVIGLGLQSTIYELEAVKVNASCLRFIEFLASQPSPISVRGNFTRDWFKSIGVDRVVATGCPSIYMNIFDQTEAPQRAKPIFQSTRYGMTKPLLQSNGINRRMFDFAAGFDCPMIYQSEPEEMELLTRGVSASTLGPDKCRPLMQLYGCASVDALDGFLKRNGRVFYDLGAWSAFISQHSAVVGTRLHGSILALNSGRPSLLVPHDSRTAEVASFAGVQTMQGPTVRDCSTLDEVEGLIADNNLQRFRDVRSANQLNFIGFLRDADLEPKTGAMF